MARDLAHVSDHIIAHVANDAATSIQNCFASLIAAIGDAFEAIPATIDAELGHVPTTFRY
eukprot:CAMPEP_0170468668 /NCGR_PEP_ID=MMETSP0123-20130129/11759_1 /TAXON_ID=182087 /ORGANISM="Favella ehrenbergii, Strain Fehren 1" /LENGTH=59 /DNA_ID=CAMNT_0010735289 /DNA_START=539 /DNA_END=718 /DNA_ORIENTATION=-